MGVAPQNLPIPQTQVPSVPSSSLCPEKNSEKASEADGWCEHTSLTSELRWPGSDGCTQSHVPLTDSGTTSSAPTRALVRITQPRGWLRASAKVLDGVRLFDLQANPQV